MDLSEIIFDDDEYSLDNLLKSPIPSFLDNNQLFGDAFFQNTHDPSSSGNVAPNQAYCSFLNATKEEQQMNVGDLESSLGRITPNLSMDEPKQHEKISAMEPIVNVNIENNEQLNDKNNVYTMDDLFEFANALSPNPKQNMIKLVYNDKKHISPPIPPTILTEYLNKNACMGGLYQGGIDLFACIGGQEQQLLSDGILPMPLPTSNLIPTMMPTPVLKTNEQNNTLTHYNMHNTFHLYDYEPTNLQVLQNRHLQQEQQNNNSSHIACCDTTASVPDISTPQASTHKRECISPQERNEQLERYKYKKRRREFRKKITYPCRKILADSRPRVRGRFAKKDVTEQKARTCSTNSNELQQNAIACNNNHVCNNDEAEFDFENLFESFDFIDESNDNNNLKELGLI